MGGRGSNSGARFGGREIERRQILSYRVNSSGGVEAQRQMLKTYGWDDARVISKPRVYSNDSMVTYEAVKFKQAPQAKPKSLVSEKVFVNSYGEATRREITSSSYNRYQSRLKKQIDNMFANR